MWFMGFEWTSMGVIHFLFKIIFTVGDILGVLSTFMTSKADKYLLPPSVRFMQPFDHNYAFVLHSKCSPHMAQLNFLIHLSINQLHSFKSLRCIEHPNGVLTGFLEYEEWIENNSRILSIVSSSHKIQ